MFTRLLWAVAIACMTLVGCSPFSRQVDGEVINRVRSPNGLLDAIITRSIGGGATVPYYYRIYLETNKTGSNYKILEANYPHGLKVEWIDNNHLTINMSCGDVFFYTNFFDFMKNGELIYQVSIDFENHGLCSVYLSKEQGFSH